MKNLVTAVLLVGLLPLPVSARNDDPHFQGDCQFCYVLQRGFADPDGVLMNPCQRFTMTWRLRNIGSTAWDGYRLAFDGGAQMQAPSSVEIPLTLPGESVDISVAMTAPIDPGRHLGVWIPESDDGNPFGLGIYVVIYVGASTYGGHTLEEWESDLDGSSIDVRKKALEALVNFGPEARPALLRIFRHDPDKELRFLALAALQDQQALGVDNVRLLLEAVSDPSPENSEMAVMLINSKRMFTQLSLESLPALIDGMKNDNPRTRTMAIIWLSDLRCAAKEDLLLRELAENDPDPDVRDLADEVLRMLEHGCV